MSKKFEPCFATDDNIFDVLMAARQKLPEGALLDMARARGIFYSPKTPREDLAVAFATLPHDYLSVKDLIQRREPSKRGVRTTSFVINADVDISDVAAVIREYKEEFRSSEDVSSVRMGNQAVKMNVGYVEVDYSKTKLIQHQSHEAEIEIVKQGSKVLVRMPATERAERISSNIVKRLENKSPEKFKLERIELAHIPSNEDRTSFFLSLLSKMDGYSLVDVKSVRMGLEHQKSSEKDPDIESDEEDNAAAAAEMLAVINNIDLRGQNVVASPVYQELHKRGYFITGIRWVAEQESLPQHRVQFDASFENGLAATGFKYGMYYAPRDSGGNYAKIFRPLRDEDKSAIFIALESTATKIISFITAKYHSGVEACP